MPWAAVQVNPCLYQDPAYNENHFAQLDDGRLEVYSVSPQPLATISAVSDCALDPQSDLVFHIRFEDRFVVLVAGSAHSRDLWLGKLSLPSLPQEQQQQQQSAEPRAAVADATASPRLVFEGVLIKSPTKPVGDNGLVDAVKSTMGAWHRRLFRLYSDGSLAYHRAEPHACVALNSASCVIIIDEGPLSCASAPPFAFTVSGETGAFPTPPSEPIPPLSRFSRHIWRLSELAFPRARRTWRVSAPGGARPHVGLDSSASSGFAEEDDEEGEDGEGAAASAHPRRTQVIRGRVTLAAPRLAVRDAWVAQIARHAAWFARHTAQAEGARQVVTKGWMWKQGRTGGAWRLRFFVLLSTREMLYYREENGGRVLGAIDLRHLGADDVRVVRSKMHAPVACTLEIETKDRVWRLCAKARSAAVALAHTNHWRRVVANVDIAFQATHPPHRAETPDLLPPDLLPPDGFSAPPPEPLPLLLPVVSRSSWQRLSGNVPPQLLAPSPYKATLLLNGHVSAGPAAKSYLLSLAPARPVVCVDVNAQGGQVETGVLRQVEMRALRRRRSEGDAIREPRGGGGSGGGPGGVDNPKLFTSNEV